jgi:hypothetical protein
MEHIVVCNAKTRANEKKARQKKRVAAFVPIE